MKKVLSCENETLPEMNVRDYLVEFSILNNTVVRYPDLTLTELLRQQAKSSPNNIALEFHDSKITYNELIEKVNQLSHYFYEHGVRSGDFVAVALNRSSELVISLLAIMQCGAAYLPLDPQYPADRLEFMLTDSAAKILVTSKTVGGSFLSQCDTLFIEDAVVSLNRYPVTNLETKVNSGDYAYLLYTSGSTGNPKGVTISHKNLVNFLCSMALEPGINENDRALSITTISFDIAGSELYLPLIKGATLVLADQDTARDGRLLLELIKKKNINFLQATPTTWRMLLDSGWSSPLPLKALCGGEAMPMDLAQDLLKKCDTLWNVYGPTETTIYSSLKQIKAEDNLITIGKPIANTQIYIIDEQCQLMAPGVMGEIAIGGDGVANGYWNRPELTTEKFIGNRFSNSKGDRLYRTGDLGKLISTNEIECLGRLDQQVKIRGHRIEPAEVEQALLLLDGIKQAVVLANNDFLIAHIVPDCSIEIAQTNIPLWRETLASKLPSHLVPYDFNILEKMPTTLNDKIDRKALVDFKKNIEIEYTGPRTEEEKTVATIWKEVLNLEKIDVFSTFFEMGGHSIKAVKVMVEMEKQTGKRFPLTILFEYSTIEKFAKLLNKDGKLYSDCLVPIKPSGNKVPFFMIHGGGLDVLSYVNLSKYFDDDQPFYGIQGTGPKGYSDWYVSIEDMAAQYIEAVVKVNPKGPYALAGFCVGGVVAFEMARQLKQQGKEVSMTLLLDSYVDSSYFFESDKQKKRAKSFTRTRKRLLFLLRMLTSWKAFKHRIQTKKEYLRNKHFDQNNAMSEQDALALEQFAEASNMIQGILDRYHLRPDNIKVDLFRSKDHPEYTAAPEHLGWKKAALKGVAIHAIPGDNFDIRVSPNDKTLARMFQEILDEKHKDLYSDLRLEQEKNDKVPSFLRTLTLINFFLIESIQADLSLYLA